MHEEDRFKNKYPGASWYHDRHGRVRWRYRKGTKTVSLPSAPGDPEFEEAYYAAVEGRAPRKAEVVKIPTSAEPRSFAAAWRLVKASAEWKHLDDITKSNQTRIAEGFLASETADGSGEFWRDMPVADLKRRHVKAILADRAETPWAAYHLLGMLRKMIFIALDEEWIDYDPTYKVKWRPRSKGWRAWTDEECEKFERRWPIGTTPRLAYALALWLGNRRGDVTNLRWDQRTTIDVFLEGKRRAVDVFIFSQEKTGKDMILPVTPMLEEVLAAAERKGETVLLTAYGEKFSPKSLTGRMRDWTKAAGLAQGCTLHGLRKTLGKKLAEAEASTRQIMDALGHSDISHAELYSREADKARMSVQAMDRVTRMVRGGNKSHG